MSPEPQKGLVRFRTRLLILILVALMVTLGFIVKPLVIYAIRHARLTSAQEDLERRGWKFSPLSYRDSTYPEIVTPMSPVDAPAIALLEKLDYIQVLTIEGREFSDKDLKRLAASSSPFRRVTINNTSITDLSPLDSRPPLWDLMFLNSPINPERMPRRVMARLESLLLEGVDLKCAAGATNARSVFIKSYPIKDLDDLPWASWNKLRHLGIWNCPRLEDIKQLSNLTQLETIDLHGSSSLADLSPLRPLSRLRFVILDDCPNLRDISGLNPSEVKWLHLRNSVGVNLAPVTKMTKLRRLDVSGAKELVNLDAVRKWAVSLPPMPGEPELIIESD